MRQDSKRPLTEEEMCRRVALEVKDGYCTTKKGKPKILKECLLPVTGYGVVNLIVTDLAVMDVTPEGLLLREVAPGYTPEEIQALTEPTFKVSEDLKEMPLV